MIAFLGTARTGAHVPSPDDRSFLLGDGCFETLRVSGGKAEGITEHIALLARSAGTLGINGYPDEAALTQAVSDLAATASGEASLRITLSRGAGGRGADASSAEPLTVIGLFPLASGRPYAPLSVITVTVARNDTSPLSRIKSTSYGDNLAARREAVALGADEALMLNTKGRPACFAMANLFLRTAGGNWITPPETEGVRPGYMRAQLLAALDAAGTPAAIRPIERGELDQHGAGLFATNSLWGVRPVAGLDTARYDIHLAPGGLQPR